MTFDEARLLANVNARAQRLFENGYRARRAGLRIVQVRSGQGATYRVDTVAHTCNCPFFCGWKGRFPCKHLLGWRRLLARQRACRRLVCLLLLGLWRDLDDGSLPAFASTGSSAAEAKESAASAGSEAGITAEGGR